MRVLSLFSGVGGFDVAAERAGMEVIGQCEIDPFCRKVLAKHWPDVARWDDVRSVGVGRSADHERGEPHDAQADSAAAQWDGPGVDLVVGGFPCQDVSVAGRRAGLDGERSGLWFEFQRIVSELRPTYVLVENVPGLLSSHRGRDFAVILNGLAQLGYGVSWRILDSRYFGLAQRRRRVFIVAGPPDGRTEAILAITEGCGGHPQTGRTAGQDVAGTIKGSVRGSGTDNSAESADRLVIANPVGGGSGARGWRDDLDHSTYVPEIVGALDTALGHHGYATSAQSAAAGHFLAVRTAQTSANGHGVAEDVAHTIDGANGQAVAHTLRSEGFDASEDGTGRGTPLVAFAQNTRDEVRLVGGDGQIVGALAAQPGMKQQSYVAGATVRRLTPTECMRLQGFPDDWFEGNDKSDGPIYRAMGNAISIPVVYWILQRMKEVDQYAQSLESLDDRGTRIAR